MKIVHLCTSDTGGGAAIAARRLMNAQRGAGYDATMLVLNKQSSDSYTYALLKDNFWTKTRIFLNKALEALLSALCCKRIRGYQLFTLSIPLFGFNVMRHSLCQEADIIHLHYTNQGYISLYSLRKLQQAHKKVVITLHDIWHIAALCHYTPDTYSFGFELATPCAKGLLSRFFAKRIFDKKKKLYSKLYPCFVGCSEWITGVARRSRLSQYSNIVAIPNIPDTQHFHPIEKKKAREVLSLPCDRAIVLYGAANTSDVRKGYKEMKASIKSFANMEIAKERKPILVVFGKANSELFSKELLGVEVKLVGFVSNSREMALYYSAADLFLTTALEENLPNTLIEAQLCNRPSVAFAVGGIPEIITSAKEGLLAKPYDTEEVALAIAQLLENLPREDDKSIAEKAIERYCEKNIVERYVAVYTT